VSRAGTVAKTAALAAAALGVGAAFAFRRIDGAWSAVEDLVVPGDRLLPVGETRRLRMTDGAELAVTLAGPRTGPLVVLAHGFTNGREVWAPVAHRLIRAGARVALYDHRGHGSSTSGTDGHTIDRLGRDLAELLEALDARDAVLVGHSMGGMTIQSFAAQHPDVVRSRVAGLVLVATAAHGIGRNDRSDQRAARAAGHRATEYVVRSRVGHAFFRSVYGLAVRRADLLLSQEGFLATTSAAREQFVDAMLSMDLRKANAAIAVPTTVLIGDRDTLLPPALGEEVAASINGSRIIRLPDVGHMLPLEAPEQVVEAVLDAAPIGQTDRSLA
jgi:pimeloyl-ACP methyl ester carboxylesterase